MEDDHDLRDSLERYLRGAGLAVRGRADAHGLVEAIGAFGADVVVLDINLPGGIDGFTAAARVQAQTTAAVIMLTGRSMHADRLRGLGVGADHYLVKPVDPAELELVVRNLGKWVRAAAPAEAERPWRFDPAQWRLVSPDGVRVGLSAVEHRLLARLLARAGEPIDRGELLAEVRQPGAAGSARALDLIVFRLRRKVEAACGAPLPLLSVRGTGYVFAGPVVREPR